MAREKVNIAPLGSETERVDKNTMRLLRALLNGEEAAKAGLPR